MFSNEKQVFDISVPEVEELIESIKESIMLVFSTEQVFRHTIELEPTTILITGIVPNHLPKTEKRRFLRENVNLNPGLH